MAQPVSALLSALLDKFVKPFLDKSGGESDLSVKKGNLVGRNLHVRCEKIEELLLAQHRTIEQLS